MRGWSGAAASTRTRLTTGPISAPPPFLAIDPEGGPFTLPAGVLADTFLPDCDPAIQRQAAGKTGQQSLLVLEQTVQSAAWQHAAATRSHRTRVAATGARWRVGQG